VSFADHETRALLDSRVLGTNSSILDLAFFDMEEGMAHALQSRSGMTRILSYLRHYPLETRNGRGQSRAAGVGWIHALEGACPPSNLAETRSGCPSPVQVPAPERRTGLRGRILGIELDSAHLQDDHRRWRC
jgi:hypothetical protein